LHHIPSLNSMHFWKQVAGNFKTHGRTRQNFQSSSD
jgi:hypothetical protein